MVYIEKGRLNVVLKLLFSLLLCQIPAFIGTVFNATSANNWYLQLYKPVFVSPSWLFGSVWSILYILMGVALFLAWYYVDNLRLQVKMSFAFSVQLILISLWPVIFFGFENLLLGLIIIVALLLAIIVMYYYYRKISDIAAALTVPYLLWVSYAVIVGFAIYTLNK